MKIFPIVDLQSDWYPKNAFDAFARYSSFQFTDTPEDADLIWVMSWYANLDAVTAPSWLGRFGSRKLKKEFRKTPVISSLHHLVPGKEAHFKPRIGEIDAISDAIHVFSQANAAAIGKYVSSSMLVMPYWIDLDLFPRTGPNDRSEARRKLDIPAEAFVVGTFQRDTEADGVSPKMEKGPDIFCDALSRADREDLFVLLAGPRRDYVENRLAEAGIPFKSLGHVPYAGMRELYAALDVYLVTSRTEGGPQAIPECMATGTPIYSTDVGIAEILSPGVVLMGGADEFAQVLNGPFPDVANDHFETVQAFNAPRVVQHYERDLQKIVAAYQQSRNLPAALPDLDWAVS